MVGCIKNSISRLRHRRGHGVHSPLVYALYREAFMKKGGGGELYDMLAAKGVPRRYAAEIDRAAWLLGPEKMSFIFPGDEPAGEGNGVVCLVQLEKQGRLYRSMVAEKKALSIDRRGYALFIYGGGLSTQHFIL